MLTRAFKYVLLSHIIILGCIAFMSSVILRLEGGLHPRAQLIKRFFSFFNKSTAVSVNEKVSSVCESIDEISKQEIEDLKGYLKSKFINIDFETYIKQF